MFGSTHTPQSLVTTVWQQRFKSPSELVSSSTGYIGTEQVVLSGYRLPIRFKRNDIISELKRKWAALQDKSDEGIKAFFWDFFEKYFRAFFEMKFSSTKQSTLLDSELKRIRSILSSDFINRFIYVLTNDTNLMLIRTGQVGGIEIFDECIAEKVREQWREELDVFRFTFQHLMQTELNGNPDVLVEGQRFISHLYQASLQQINQEHYELRAELLDSVFLGNTNGIFQQRPIIKNLIYSLPLADLDRLYSECLLASAKNKELSLADFSPTIDDHYIKIINDAENRAAFIELMGNPKIYFLIKILKNPLDLQLIEMACKANPDSKELAEIKKALFNYQAKIMLLEKRVKKYRSKFEADSGEWKGSTTANIDLPKSHPMNKAFVRNHKRAKEILCDFTNEMCQITEISAKELDLQAHVLRSLGREATVNIWYDEVAKKYCFIVYEPAGRYTKEQAAHLGLSDEQVYRDHALTSHNKKDNVQGLSSFVHVISGTIDDSADEQSPVVKIHYDSFSGPSGGRIPYEDLKKIKSNPFLAIELAATAMRTQREMVQAILQKRLNALSNENLIDQLQKLWDERVDKPFTMPLPTDRNQLMELYVEHYLPDHPPELGEAFMHVVTPGQWFSSKEFQKEQFEYTLGVLDLFNGREVTGLSVWDGKGGEKTDLSVKYKSRMSCYGVNWFRNSTTAHQNKQNCRAMNELHDDVQSFLDKNFQDSDLPEVFVKNFNALRQLLMDLNSKYEKKLIELQKSIDDKKQALITTHTKLEELLGEYSRLYKTWESNGQPKSDVYFEDLNKKKEEVERLQDEIKKTKNDLYKDHEKLKQIRRAQWKKSKKEIKKIRKELIANIQQYLTDNPQDTEVKANLLAYYNILGIYADIQDLYYESGWKKTLFGKSKNFRMQSLIQNLYSLLDFDTTLTCKSNNDRAKKLLQAMLSNRFTLELSDEGLYLGKCYGDKEWNRHSKKVAHGPMREHHIDNCGIGGGKFDSHNSGPESLMWAYSAEMAKLDKMKNSTGFFKRKKIKAQVKKDLVEEVGAIEQSCSSTVEVQTRARAITLPNIHADEGTKDHVVVADPVALTCSLEQVKSEPEMKKEAEESQLVPPVKHTQVGAKVRPLRAMSSDTIILKRLKQTPTLSQDESTFQLTREHYQIGLSFLQILMRNQNPMLCSVAAQGNSSAPVEFAQPLLVP